MHEPVSDLPNLLFLDHALKASKMLSGVSELSGGHCSVDVCSFEMPVFLFAPGLTCFIRCAMCLSSPTTNSLKSSHMLVQIPWSESLYKRVLFLILHPLVVSYVYEIHFRPFTPYYPISSVFCSIPSSCQHGPFLLSCLCVSLTY